MRFWVCIGFVCFIIMMVVSLQITINSRQIAFNKAQLSFNETISKKLQEGWPQQPWLYEKDLDELLERQKVFYDRIIEKQKEVINELKSK